MVYCMGYIDRTLKTNIRTESCVSANPPPSPPSTPLGHLRNPPTTMASKLSGSTPCKVTTTFGDHPKITTMVRQAWE